MNRELQSSVVRALLRNMQTTPSIERTATGKSVSARCVINVGEGQRRSYWRRAGFIAFLHGLGRKEPFPPLSMD